MKPRGDCIIKIRYFNNSGIHILSYKTQFNKFKRTDIIQYWFPDQNEIRLEINNIKRVVKFPYIWRLKSICLKNTWAKKEISGDIEKCFELNENENITYQQKQCLEGNL